MPEPSDKSEHVSEVDTALLDAELFIKYQAPERAMKRLRSAIEVNPRSILLRERLREVCISHKQPEEAAKQCLALASIYIEREEFDIAHDRLLESKQFDERINIASGLEAIRRARRPDLRPEAAQAQVASGIAAATLAGDLAVINVFDAIQVLENAKLTGTLELSNDSQSVRVHFNEGRIVDAESGGKKGDEAFKQTVEITNGGFEFHRSADAFPVGIQALSNTNLILDTLRLLDEENQ